jgi:hypothetical protein
VGKQKRKYSSSSEKSAAKKFRKALDGADVIAVAKARGGEHHPGFYGGVLVAGAAVVAAIVFVLAKTFIIPGAIPLFIVYGLLCPQRFVVVTDRGLVAGQGNRITSGVTVMGPLSVAEVGQPSATSGSQVRVRTVHGPMWFSRKEHQRLLGLTQHLHAAPEGYQVYQPWVGAGA